MTEQKDRPKASTLADAVTQFDARRFVQAVVAVVEPSEADVSSLTPDQVALIEAHLEMAEYGARKYKRIAGGRYTLEELRSAAHMGLVIAAQKFDPTRGVKFSTYAFNWTDNQLRQVHRDALVTKGFSKTHTKREREQNIADGRPEFTMPRRVTVQAWPTNEEGNPIDLVDKSARIDDEIARQDDVAHRCEIVIAHCKNDRAKEIMRRRFRGMSHRAIGAEFGYIWREGSTDRR